MKGDIWVSVNTAILKLDVWVGSFRGAGKGVEVPFQMDDSRCEVVDYLHCETRESEQWEDVQMNF